MAPRLITDSVRFHDMARRVLEDSVNKITVSSSPGSTAGNPLLAQSL